MPKTSEVTFEGEGRRLEAYLALPDDRPAPFPGVVLIHEIRGLDEHIRDVARRLAAQGYATLAPDLYTGEWRERATPERLEQGLALRRRVPPEAQRDPARLELALAGRPAEEQEALRTVMAITGPAQRERFARDLCGAVRYLRGRPEVEADRVASLGFCMGGALSGLLATLSPELKACAIFYGDHPPLDRVTSIRASVLGIYGEEDHRITGAVPEFAEAMRRAGKPFAYHVYKAAPHAFFNDTRPSYRAEAAADAWQRLLGFLGRELNAPAGH